MCSWSIHGAGYTHKQKKERGAQLSCRQAFFECQTSLSRPFESHSIHPPRLAERREFPVRFFFFRIVIVLFLYSPVACLHRPDWRYNAAGVSSKRKKDALVVNNRDVLRLPSYQKKRGEGFCRQRGGQQKVMQLVTLNDRDFTIALSWWAIAHLGKKEKALRSQPIFHATMTNWRIELMNWRCGFHLLSAALIFIGYHAGEWGRKCGSLHWKKMMLSPRFVGRCKVDQQEMNKSPTAQKEVHERIL